MLTVPSVLCPNSFIIILWYCPMCTWYPGCVHGYVYLISLVLGNQVFPGAQPKCIILYMFNTAPTHTLLHNSVDHQLNCPLVCLLCHCVELLPASTFFSRYTLQFERFKLPRLGSITKGNSIGDQLSYAAGYV